MSMYPDPKILVRFLEDDMLPETVGVTFLESSTSRIFLSYRKMREKALMALGSLNASGVRKGDELIIYIDDNQSFTIIFWACLFGGIVAVPLASGNQPSHKHKVLSVWKKLRKPYVVAEDKTFLNLAKYARENDLGQEFLHVEGKRFNVQHILGDHSHIPDISPAGIDEVIYLQYSSGSTGDPKGVQLTNRNIFCNIQDIVSTCGIGSTDSMLSWMPLTHDMGLIGVHLTGIVAGIPQYLMPSSLFVRRPLSWLNFAHEYKVSLLYSPNFGFEYLLNGLTASSEDAWDLASVRLVFNGAEPIDINVCDAFAKTMRRYGLKDNVMFPVYGLAEASVAVTVPDLVEKFIHYRVERKHLKPGKPVRMETSAYSGLSLVEVGKCVPSCQLRICDDDDQVLEEEMVGHIQIMGYNVTRGYYNDDVANSVLFTADNWLRTGDLGFLRNGNLTVVGRRKDMIIINGQNIYLHDMERTVYGTSCVRPGSVAIVSIPGTNSTAEKLAAFIVHKGQLQEFEELVPIVRGALFKVYGVQTDYILPVRRIPKTTSGKMRRFELAQRVVDGEFNDILRDQLRMRSEKDRDLVTDDRLLSICRSVLGCGDLKPGDRLSDFGMNSLNSVRLVSKIKAELNVNITVTDVFECDAVHVLSEFVHRQPKVFNEPYPSAQLLSVSNTLSYSQERFLILDAYGEHSGAFNIFQSYVLSGSLDMPAVTRAANRLVDRHEILRTAFRVEDGKCRATLVQSADVECGYVDLSAHDNPYDKLQRLGNTIINEQFKPDEPPLFRVVIYKLSDSEHVLLFVTHHLVMDGWSMKILLEEFAQYYSFNSRVPDDPEPRFQYREFALMQKHHAAWESADLKSYWGTELRGNPQVLDFGKSTLDPAIGAAGYRYFEIEPATYNRIKRMSAENHVTEFSVIMTALNVVFYKYTGQEDFIVNTTVANRVLEVSDRVIGNFTNTLPIRTIIESSTEIPDLLKAVHRKILGAIDHQSVPFEVLSREFQFLNTVNVLVVFQNFDFEFDSLGNSIHASPYVHFRQNQSIADLHLEFQTHGSALSVICRYRDDVFSEFQIENLIRHFSNVIFQASDGIVRTVRLMNCLADEERRTLLGFGTGVVTRYQASELNIAEAIRSNARMNPDRVAVIFDDRSLTYGELVNVSDSISEYLADSHELTRGQTIGLMLQRSDLGICTIVALLKSGLVYVPIDPDFPEERIRFVLDDCRTAAIITDRDISKINARCPVIDAGNIHRNAGTRSYVDASDNDPDGTAYIVYTSGTTGKPKGVVIPRSALSDYVAGFSHYFKITPDDRVMHQSSPSFDTAVEEIFPVLVKGGTCVVCRARPTGHGLAALIELERVTVLSTVPSLISEINSVAHSVRRLRMLISGGEALHKNHLDRLARRDIQLYNSYGPCEVTVCSSFERVDDTESSISIGRPMPNHSMHILDRDYQLLPVGVPGQICIGGAGLACGYLNNPELTAKTFVLNPFEPGQRLYLSGDIGCQLPDGRIKFIGRRDKRIKLNGIRVELGEIEQVLLGFKGISNVKVVTRRKDDRDHSLVAVYTSDEEVSEMQMVEHLSVYLPHYMVPASFVPLSSLPRTVSGKIDMEALPDIIEKAEEREHKGPATHLERCLVRAWEAVLQRTNIGIFDPFFQFGGDSIKAIQICSVLSRDHVTIDPKDIYIGRYIQRIAQNISVKQPVQGDNTNIMSPFTGLAYSNTERLERFSHGIALEADGLLNMDILRKSLEFLCCRLKVLTDSCHVVGGKLQFVPGTVQPGIDVIHIAHEGKITSETRALMTEIRLTSGNLFRARVLRIARDRRDVLVLVANHALLDPLSWNIVLRDLTNIYRLVAEGRQPSGLKPVENKRDIESKIFNYKNSAAYRHARDYWHEKTDPAHPVVELRERKRVYRTIDFSHSFLTTKTLRELHSRCNIDYPVVLLLAFLQSVPTEGQLTEFPVEVWDYRRKWKDVDFADLAGAYPVRFPVNVSLGTPAIDPIVGIKESFGRASNNGLAYHLSGEFNIQSDTRFEIMGEISGDVAGDMFKTYLFYDEPLLPSKSTFKVIAKNLIVDNRLKVVLACDQELISGKEITSFAERLKERTESLVSHLDRFGRYSFTPSDFDSVGIETDDLTELLN